MKLFRSSFREGMARLAAGIKKPVGGVVPPPEHILVPERFEEIIDIQPYERINHAISPELEDLLLDAQLLAARYKYRDKKAYRLYYAIQSALVRTTVAPGEFPADEQEKV